MTAPRRKPTKTTRVSSRRKLTIVVSAKTLARAARLADQSAKPVADFVADFITSQLNDREGYDAALRRIERRLATGFDFGTSGKATWNRDDVHAR